MTAAELSRLVTALVGDITVREAVIKYDQMADDELALLVRWLAGDKHVAASPSPAPARPTPESGESPGDHDLGDVTLLG